MAKFVGKKLKIWNGAKNGRASVFSPLALISTISPSSRASAYSRHAHILDFDMLRLGRKMLEDNPNRNGP